MNIFIVMPVFNEAKRVANTLKQVLSTNFDIVVVDDGSRDKSISEIESVKSKKIHLLKHVINLGKGAALKTGCDYAFLKGADAVIMMDSDGQHAAADLPLFMEKLESGKYDIVFGSRNLNLGVPLVRYIGNKVASLIVSLVFGIYVSDLISGFRAMTKKAYQKVRWNSSPPPGYDVETEMVIRIKKSGLKYCEIPVTTIYYDSYKGVSILDAISVAMKLIYWKFTI